MYDILTIKQYGDISSLKYVELYWLKHNWSIASLQNGWDPSLSQIPLAKPTLKLEH